MADTEAVVAAACAHPLNSRYGANCGRLQLDDIRAMWAGVGHKVHEQLTASGGGRGTVLPGLGEVTLAKAAVQGGGRQRVPQFVLDGSFARSHRLRQAEALPLSHLDRSSPLMVSGTGSGIFKATVPSHPLPFRELEARSGLPASSAANVFRLIVQEFGELARQGPAFLSLEPVGELQAVNGRCQLLFFRDYCATVGLCPPPQKDLGRRRQQPGGGGPCSRATMVWARADPPSHSAADEQRSGRRSVLSPARERPPSSSQAAALRDGTTSPRSVSDSSGNSSSHRGAGDRVPLDVPVMSSRPDTWQRGRRSRAVAWQDEDDEVLHTNSGKVPRDSCVGSTQQQDPYALQSGQPVASSIDLRDTGPGGPDAVATRRQFELPQAPPEFAGRWDHSKSGGIYVNAEQMQSIRRMCRLLDVFGSLDRSSCGYIKAHDLSVGLPAVGITPSGSDAHALVDFLNKGGGSCKVSRLEFVRAFQFYEQLGPAEKPLKLRVASFCAGEVIMKAGNPADRIFVLQQGEAVVEHGGRTVHVYSEAGDHFGARGGSLVSTVRARTDAVCIVVTDAGHDSLEYSHRDADADADADAPALLDRWERSNANNRKGTLRNKPKVNPHDLLRKVPFFESMPHELTLELAKKMCLKRVPKNRWITREGDFGDAMYIVVEGVADVIKRGVSESQVQSLRLRDCSETPEGLHMGAFWGEMALCVRGRNARSVRSRVATGYLVLSTVDFEQVLKDHPAWRYAVVQLAQQRRLLELRGDGGAPRIFWESAACICDTKEEIAGRQHRAVSIWQLRSLSRDVLLSWADADIDWLLAGGTRSELKPDPATQLRFNDPKQAIDYNKLILGLDQLELSESQKASSDTWEDWHREWSEDHNTHYYAMTSPRGTTRASQWKPPPKSPWAEGEQPTTHAGEQTMHTGGDAVAGRTRKPEPLHDRSTSPWPAAVSSTVPQWLRKLLDLIAAKSLNVRVLLRTIDTDNSGTISHHEMESGLRRVGITLQRHEFLELLEAVDPTDMGEVEIERMAKWLLRADDPHDATTGAMDWKRRTFAKLREWIQQAGLTWEKAFKRFLKAGKAHLDCEDFYEVIRKADSSLSTWQMNELFQIVDTEKTGRLVLGEWLYRFEDRVRAPDWEQRQFSKLRELMGCRGISLNSLMRRLDTNSDSSLSVRELARGISSVDPTCSNSDAIDMARCCDTQSSGTVSKQVLSQKLTGQMPVTADWEDAALKDIRKRLLAEYTSDGIAAAFAKFDLDGSGTLDREEFRRGIQSLGVGISIGQIERLRQQIDVDGDGDISFHEFVNVFLRRQILPQDQVRSIKRALQLCVFDLGISWRGLFDRFDDNKSGLLSVQDLKNGLMALPGLRKRVHLTEATIEGLFILADQSDDGSLAYAEFSKFFSADSGRVSIVPDDLAQIDTDESPLLNEMEVSAAIEKFRSRIFEQRMSTLEAFRAFDVDNDGFVSREEFITGFDGSSREVTQALGDLKLLNLSAADVQSIYDAMPGSQRDFVSFDEFSHVAADEKPRPNWDVDIVKTVQKYMRHRALNVDQTFKAWNYRNNGMLDLIQLSKGLRGAGVKLTTSLCKQFFKQMDDDGDGIINIDGEPQHPCLD
jgi:Ca2+-binding EF-hand superfamily protein/CRP-like cAMP-binding protein